MKNISQKRGFMQIVFLAVVIIAGLAYFNIDLRGLLDTPVVHKITNTAVIVWSVYLKPLGISIWAVTLQVVSEVNFALSQGEVFP